MASQVIFETRLPLEICKQRLALNIDAEKMGFSLSGYAGALPILGKIEGNRFRLQKRRCYRNSFAPFFYGYLVASENGTCVEGSFRMHSFVRVFMAIWFSGVGVAILAAAVDRHSRLQAIAVPIGMMIFGIALIKSGRFIARNEEKAIVEFIERTLERA